MAYDALLAILSGAGQGYMQGQERLYQRRLEQEARARQAEQDALNRSYREFDIEDRRADNARQNTNRLIQLLSADPTNKDLQRQLQRQGINYNPMAERLYGEEQEYLKQGMNVASPFRSDYFNKVAPPSMQNPDWRGNFAEAMRPRTQTVPVTPYEANEGVNPMLAQRVKGILGQGQPTEPTQTTIPGAVFPSIGEYQSELAAKDRLAKEADAVLARERDDWRALGADKANQIEALHATGVKPVQTRKLREEVWQLQWKSRPDYVPGSKIPPIEKNFLATGAMKYAEEQRLALSKARFDAQQAQRVIDNEFKHLRVDIARANSEIRRNNAEAVGLSLQSALARRTTIENTINGQRRLLLKYVPAPTSKQLGVFGKEMSPQVTYESLGPQHKAEYDTIKGSVGKNERLLAALDTQINKLMPIEGSGANTSPQSEADIRAWGQANGKSAAQIGTAIKNWRRSRGNVR